MYSFAQFTFFAEKVSRGCPAETKSLLLYTQDPTIDQSFSIKVGYEPNLELYSVQDSYEVSVCSSKFTLRTKGKWSIAATSFAFTGYSIVFSEGAKDTYAGIESSVVYGNRGDAHSPNLASLHFPEHSIGPFYKEFKLAQDVIHWSACNDSVIIDLQLSIQIDSIHDLRLLALDKQQVFFSFKKCD
jgi:hypothetical protein